MIPISRSLLAAALAAATLVPFAASSQDTGGACIVAGRLADDGHWAPRFEGVELLASDGKLLRAGGAQALAGVKQARLAQPALLARCDGNGPLVRADDEPAGSKQQVPALSAGLVDVDGFPQAAHRRLAGRTARARSGRARGDADALVSCPVNS
jgi:hypothetical protein